MKNEVIIARREYNDSSLGDITFYLPLKKLKRGNLCIGSKGGDIVIDVLYDNEKTHIGQFKSKLINARGRFIFYGVLPITKNWIKFFYNAVVEHLQTGIRGEIMETFSLLNVIELREKQISVADLVEKDACREELKKWLKRYGKKEIGLDEVLRDKRTTEDEYAWLQKHFRRIEPQEGIKEDIWKFLFRKLK